MDKRNCEILKSINKNVGDFFDPKNAENVLELMEAFFDVLDGVNTWNEIQEATGLDENRCKEISNLFIKISKILGYRI